MPKTKRQTSVNKQDCPLCEGYGYIMSETGMKACECQRERLQHERLRAARIPDKFLAKSLENFEARDKKRKHIVDAAHRYIQGFNLGENNRGLLVFGATGAGKTHIAVAILKGIIAKGYTGLYYNVPELLRRLRESYDPQSEEVESDILVETTECDLLVLDDLGAELTSGWVRDRLYLIINRRYEQSKPTIITTNCDLAELGERVGARITSRLYEMCQKFEEFPDEDYRKKTMKW